MTHIFLRDRVRMLRKKGKSLNEITRSINVPKSTVRYWCRNIILSQIQQKRLISIQRMGGARAAEAIRARRIKLTERLFKEGVSEIRNLTRRERFLIGIALYWAEGYRKGNQEFGFTNSDPQMVRFLIRWLTYSCGIDKKRVYARICINASYQNHLKEISYFWRRITKFDQSQFSNPTFIRVANQKKYLDKSGYHGLLRVKVRRSTNFRRKIMGWIAGIAKG